MVRALMLMDLHGWEHETAFARYLAEHPALVDALDFEMVPTGDGALVGVPSTRVRSATSAKRSTSPRKATRNR
jgi:hypothetical protein